MNQDGISINSKGGGQLEVSTNPALTAIGRELGEKIEWGPRLDMFARRCAAWSVDLLIMGGLAASFVALPYILRYLFEDWYAPAGGLTPAVSLYLDICLQIAVGVSLLIFLFIYAALSESGPAQATPGKILFGLRTTDCSGRRQTFSEVLRRLVLKYGLLAVVLVSTEWLVNTAADYISTLQLEEYRLTVKILLVLATFTLCIVEERRQNLYDIFTGRLVVNDQSMGAAERIGGFRRALGNNIDIFKMRGRP